MNAQALQMMEPMKPTQEVRVMTEREAKAEVLRNRTEKDEKEFQNYYATLKTGGERNLARALWVSGTTGGSQVLRGFLTVSMET